MDRKIIKKAADLIDNEIFKNGLFLKDGSEHGHSHFQQVERYGLSLARKNGADKLVISLFAYLHDARRENDDDDPDHGLRAAQLLDQLIASEVLDLNKKQYEQLSYALIWHNSDLAASEDITIRTCWDADRLDLTRVGIQPDPNRLFTSEGREACAYI